MSFRVRQVIRRLNAKKLQKDWVIPPCLFYEVPKQGGYLPPLYRKMGASDYGLFMEVIVNLAIQRLPLTDALHYLDPVYHSYFRVDDYNQLQRVLVDHFPPQSPNWSHSSNTQAQVQVEPEWVSGPLMGHPDLVGESIIYDIKTTGRFSAMREETILQLLSYYCLGQRLFPGRYKGIGLILPVTAQVIVILLEGWNWQPFWKVLKAQIQELKPKVEVNAFDQLYFMVLCQEHCGRHTRKTHLLRNLQDSQDSKALQFFVGGNTNSNISQTAYRELPTMSRAVTQSSAPVYIHAPYTLNPSNRNQRAGDGSVPWVITKTKDFLEYGAQLGARGVVIHCGKIAKSQPDIALQNMFETVCSLAPYVNQKCPLLIETSAGQKGELLAAPQDFISFWQALPPEVQAVTQTCIDTCHVFAAGYDPMDFIEQVEGAAVPIKLIHFNDSQHPKGACRDRHAMPGRGYIGALQLSQVLQWAVLRNMDCVHE